MGKSITGMKVMATPVELDAVQCSAMTRITILTCLMLTAAIASPSALAETALQKGVRQYNARQFTEAISTLMAAAQQDGRNPEIHYTLGNAFLQTGDSVRAVREYELGYSLAGTGPVAAYCRSALAGVRQRNRSATANTTYRSVAYGGRSVIHCPGRNRKSPRRSAKGHKWLVARRMENFQTIF